MGMSEWALILGVVALALIVIAVVVVGRRRRTGGDLSPVETTRPSRIGRSAAALGASLRRAWGSGLEEHTWQDLEEALLGADIGLESTASVVAGVRAAAPRRRNRRGRLSPSS